MNRSYENVLPEKRLNAVLNVWCTISSFSARVAVYWDWHWESSGTPRKVSLVTTDSHTWHFTKAWLADPSYLQIYLWCLFLLQDWAHSAWTSHDSEKSVHHKMEQTCNQKTTLPAAKVHNPTIYCVNFIHIHVHSRIESSVTNLDHFSYKAILWAKLWYILFQPPGMSIHAQDCQQCIVRGWGYG